MREKYNKRNHLQISHVFWGIFSFTICLYFAYHLVYGEMGYFSMKKIDATLNESKKEYDDLKQERVGLENRVKRLRPDSLDLDVLDERSRDVLGYVKEDEVILINK